jgi:hypothetical protein
VHDDCSNVTAAHLREIFSHYGAVKDVELCKDHRVGLSKGYAYVEFEEREKAVEAQLYLDGVRWLAASILLAGFGVLTLVARWCANRAKWTETF